MSGLSPEQKAKSDEVHSALPLAIVSASSNRNAEVLAELSAVRVLLLKQQELIEAQQKQLEQQAEEIVQLKHAMAEKVEVKALLPFFEEQNRREEAEMEQKRLESLREAEEIRRRYARKLGVAPSFALHASSPLLAKPVRMVEAKEDPKEVEELLRRVAYGEQEEAEVLIQKKPELLLFKGRVTDLSKRKFKEITAFQYAVWALDWHMWRMLLKYLAEEEAALQWNELEGEGTAHGKQVNWQSLIDAYTAYMPITIAGAAASWSKACEIGAQAHWIKQIGNAQLLLPVHVVNEYCHERRTFYHLPNFESTAKLTRSRLSGGIDWYDDRCGQEWAHYRGRGEDVCHASYITNIEGHGTQDKEALASLLEIRQRQRVELGSILLRLQTIRSTLDLQLRASLVAIIEAYDERTEVLRMNI